MQARNNAFSPVFDYPSTASLPMQDRESLCTKDCDCGWIAKGSTASELVETAATLGPTESEIAVAAYQLWLDRGCPIGSDQEDWFRAEAALKKALRDTRTQAEMVIEIRWSGHWEAWEMEWGDPRWVWD